MLGFWRHAQPRPFINFYVPPPTKTDATPIKYVLFYSSWLLYVINFQYKFLLLDNRRRSKCLFVAKFPSDFFQFSLSNMAICFVNPCSIDWLIRPNQKLLFRSDFQNYLVKKTDYIQSDRKQDNDTVIQWNLSWQSRDSISTVAPPLLFGLLNRTEWHNPVEIESRGCQDMRGSTLISNMAKL